MKRIASDLRSSTEEEWKSEGERQIGRLLNRCGIRYRYEYPLAVIDRGKLRIWYADFWLPEYGVFLEYVGMKGCSTYDALLEHKRRVYAELGLPVLYLGPEAFRGWWPPRVLESIETLLAQGLDSFRERADAGRRP